MTGPMNGIIRSIGIEPKKLGHRRTTFGDGRSGVG